MKPALLRGLLFAACHSLFAAQLLAAEDDESDQDDSAEESGALEPTDSEPPKQSKDDAEETDSDFGHGGQFGLRAALVAGYRMVLRYDESPFCRDYDPAKSAQDQVKFCGHTAPLAVDLGLSFAPLDFIEPFVWARLGLAREAETRTEAVVILGAGARIYTMSDSAFKIYAEPAIGVELEGGGDEALWSGFDYKNDIVFHFAAGPQFDLARNVGLFADAGLTVGILRAIHASLELKAGVQARFP